MTNNHGIAVIAGGMVVAGCLTVATFAYNNRLPPHALPDQALTPGYADARVWQQDILKTICVSGYTKTVRPPPAYTNMLKWEQLENPKYAYTDKNPRDCEEDHLIPLELGGNPDQATNLWCQPYKNPCSALPGGNCGARDKDVLERKLNRLVCGGKLTLDQARHAIATNWIEAYKIYVVGK